MANKIERVIAPLPATEEAIVPQKLVFFCRNCEKVVQAKQTRKKFVFACPLCGKTEIAFGTAISVQNFYHLSEEDMVPVVVDTPAPVIMPRPPLHRDRGGKKFAGPRPQHAHRPKAPGK